MKIIILGAGEFGSTLAKYLLTENHDITVVDNNLSRLDKLQDKLDIRVVSGYASYPNILIQAGLNTADVLIAATGSDEVNILACHISYILFSIPYRIAKIKSIEYINQADIIFSINKIPINCFIYSEELVTSRFFDLIQYPGTLKNIRLYNDKVILSIVRFCADNFLIGIAIYNIKKYVPNIPFIIPIIIRNHNLIFPNISTILENNDEVFFISFSKDISRLIKIIQKKKKYSQYIMIVGGGKIGLHLAKVLEKQHCIKLIESDKKRAEEVSTLLKNTTVLFGEAENTSLLFDENISKVDFFISVTDTNEVNILSAMLAKKMGAKTVIVLVDKRSYIDLFIGSHMIDIIIFYQEPIISQLLNYIGNSMTINRFLLQYRNMAIIEIIISNNNIHANIIGYEINKIKLPSDIIVIAIIKDNRLHLNSDNYFIEDNDHIIILSTNNRPIKEIEILF
ncbi:MAG TPA: Trk system potassium transporter TrkA [Buchnera sp. (in: enterobacteria)]|nr:Trk system potassium transporter TrkA [Buchnera sp. (in: enterobacteria)]